MPKGTTPSTLISETQCFSSRKKKALLRVYTYQTWNLSGVTQSQGLGNFPCKAVSSQKDALQIFGTHPPNSQIRGVWKVPEARTQGHLPSCKLYMPFEFQCVYLWTTYLLRKKNKGNYPTLNSEWGKEPGLLRSYSSLWVYSWWMYRVQGERRHVHLWIVPFVSLSEGHWFFDNFTRV